MPFLINDDDVVALREHIKKAYKEYPTQSGIKADAMVDQAIRSAYIRGYTDAKVDNS